MFTALAFVCMLNAVAGRLAGKVADFSDGLLASWFKMVNYIGAFAAGDNWLNGWIEFDPQDAEY